jgi:hypothetical protein
MKTEKENWKECFMDELDDKAMLRIRGGDGPGPGEDPDQPIVK